MTYRYEIRFHLLLKNSQTPVPKDSKEIKMFIYQLMKAYIQYVRQVVWNLIRYISFCGNFLAYFQIFEFCIMHILVKIQEVTCFLVYGHYNMKRNSEKTQLRCEDEDENNNKGRYELKHNQECWQMSVLYTFKFF